MSQMVQQQQQQQQNQFMRYQNPILQPQQQLPLQQSVIQQPALNVLDASTVVAQCATPSERARGISRKFDTS